MTEPCQKKQKVDTKVLVAAKSALCLKPDCKRIRSELAALKQAEKSRREEEEANKPDFKCCRHIDETCKTKLQPRDRITPFPSQYSAYCQTCKSGRTLGFTQGDEYWLVWQCNNCCEAINTEDVELLCDACEDKFLEDTGSYSGAY